LTVHHLLNIYNTNIIIKLTATQYMLYCLMHGFSGTVEQSCVKVTVIRTCKTVNLKQQVALGHHQKYCHCNKKLHGPPPVVLWRHTTSLINTTDADCYDGRTLFTTDVVSCRGRTQEHIYLNTFLFETRGSPRGQRLEYGTQSFNWYHIQRPE